MFDKLFSPIKIRDLQLPHRIVLPAMGTKFSGNDSYVTDKLIDYHVARVKGGSGLNIVEVASVHTPSAPRHFLSISDDKYIPGLKRLTPWYRVSLRCDYRCYIIIKSRREGKVVDSLDIM